MDSRAAGDVSGFLGHWQEENSAFLFFSAPAVGEVETILRAQPHLRLIESTRMSYEQWQGPGIAGQRFGCFRFLAPWAPEAQGGVDGADEFPILLDPGLVFGAGNHPTTRDCLMALELAAQSAPAETALDLGTGTGILSWAHGCWRSISIRWRQGPPGAMWGSISLRERSSWSKAGPKSSSECRPISRSPTFTARSCCRCWTLPVCTALGDCGARRS